MVDISPQEVIQYWFGADVSTTAAIQKRKQLWFANDAAIDAAMRQRFGHLPERLREQPHEWPMAVADGVRQHEVDVAELARVLVWDQFTRNCFRGSATAFAYDELALNTARRAIAGGVFTRLDPVWCRFLVMPYEHSEELQVQQEGVALSITLRELAPEHLRAQFDYFLKYARIHRDLIQRFGRFPHRNQVLGRIPSAEEEAYLAQGGHRFGQ